MDFCAATQLPPGEGEINDVPAEVSAQNALLRGSLWAEIDVFFLACVMPLMLMGEAAKMELQDKIWISDVIGMFQLGVQRPTKQQKHWRSLRQTYQAAMRCLDTMW